MRNIILFFVAFSFLGGLRAQMAHGYEFEVRGKISSTGYSPDGQQNGAAPLLNFTLQVSNSMYLLRLTGYSKENYDYRECAYDGQYLYLLNSMVTRVDADKSAGKKVGSNVATAWIYKNQHAITEVSASQMGVIWLMFASGEYFKSTTSNLVEPVVLLGIYRATDTPQFRGKQQAFWKLQEMPPYCPIEAYYLDDGIEYLPFPIPPKKRLAPFDVGFTNIIFKINGFTNVDGLQMPTDGVLETFKPKPDHQKETGGTYRVSRYHISTTSVKVGSSEIAFRPVLPGETFIGDARFYQQADNLSYVSTNVWPSEMAITNKEAFKKATLIKAKKYKSGTEMPSRRWLIIAVLVITFAAFLIALLVTKSKHK